MAECFLCGEDRDTRRVFMGNARGYAEMCFDCTLKFYKIGQEEER